jgi:hypothetical protein
MINKKVDSNFSQKFILFFVYSRLYQEDNKIVLPFFLEFVHITFFGGARLEQKT